MRDKNKLITLSKATLERLPLYYRALTKFTDDRLFIKSDDLGGLCDVSGVQVRKDLTIFRDIGRPNYGYNKGLLKEQLENFLGIRNVNDVALVGCGNLGKALIRFPGFSDVGINIALLFDNDKEKIGSKILSREIYPVDNLHHYASRLNIQIGVICTPTEAAQKIGEKLVEAGIIFICNYAPITLKLPSHVHIRNEDLVTGFVLAGHHVNKLNQDDKN